MNNAQKIENPFKFYCQKVIPLAFDESMSYYEVLCGLTAYLHDTVIPAVNNNASALTELQNLYRQLKNYVDNYFNNLDVQTEINNKLDEMSENGALQDIILNYLNITKIYDTTELMIADVNNLSANMKIQTLGYHSLNDGGGGLFIIKEQPDITKFNININNLYAELITYDTINIKQMGAYGNNQNDDSSIIQQALNLYNNVFIPEGIYLITTPLQLKLYSKLYGINNRTSIITTSNEIDIINKLNDVSYYNVIENIGIDGNNVANIGINLTGIRESYLNNVLVKNCKTGVYLNNSWSNTLLECNIFDNLIQNIYLGDASNDINILDCKLDLAGQYGINIAGSILSNMININGCVFQQCGISAIYCHNTTSLNISNCYFENNNVLQNANGYDIDINALSTTVINLLNNSFYLQDETSGIHITKAKDIIINNIYSARNNTTKQFNVIDVDDLASIQHIYLFNFGVSDTDNLLINDNNNKITNFSANTINMSSNIKINKNYPELTINSLNSGNPTLRMSINDVQQLRLYLNRTNNILYLEKLNNTSQTQENLIQISATNTILPQKPIRSEFQMYGRIQPHFGTTDTRPNTPFAGEIFFDTTLGKPIFYTGSKWVDGIGTTV